ncbi:MFS transporter [Klebsiella pneumoniae]|nr:MFS transporter [Klebsiella pneumoniae]
MARASLSWALILGLLSGIGPLCTDFYPPALPEITQQLQATSTQTQLSLTAALIGLGLGQLFFGPLSDRIGRLKPLALSLLLFIFSSAMCALDLRYQHADCLALFTRFLAGAGGSVLSRSIARDINIAGHPADPVFRPVDDRERHCAGAVPGAGRLRYHRLRLANSLSGRWSPPGGAPLVMSLADPAGNAPGHSGACQLPTARPAGAEKSPLSALLPDPGLHDGRAVLPTSALSPCS